jgi:hypothetical protein
LTFGQISIKLPVSGLFPAIFREKNIAREKSHAMLILKDEPQETAF